VINAENTNEDIERNIGGDTTNIQEKRTNNYDKGFVTYWETNVLFVVIPPYLFLPRKNLKGQGYLAMKFMVDPIRIILGIFLIILVISSLFVSFAIEHYTYIIDIKIKSKN